MAYLVSGDPARSLTDYYPSWLDNLADDVTIMGSAMDGVAQGPEAVRIILAGIRTLLLLSRLVGEKLAGTPSPSTPPPASRGDQNFSAGVSRTGTLSALK